MAKALRGDTIIDLLLYTDISTLGIANRYLVKGAGNYKFKKVQSSSDRSVGNVKIAEVL